MLNNITLGQYFPGNSYFHKMDPRAKILITMILIMAIFIANSVAAYALVGLLAIFSFILSKLPLNLIWKSIKPLWVIIVFTMIVHVLSTPGTPVWQWEFISVTQEGIRQGALMTTRLVFLLVFSSLLTFTTSPIVLTDGIEYLLSPFKRIGVPAHELAMMMTIALRFIPTLLEETDRIMKAQTARGAEFETGSMIQRAKNMVPILVPLFISAFRRADELATAMEARCYRGGDMRTRMNPLFYTQRDYVGMSVIVAFTILMIVMRYYGI